MTPKASIAVIDDDQAVLKSTSALLAAYDFETRCFASASAFLEDDNLEGIDCILLDVRMPGLSGLELQNILSQRHAAIPIVFITAHGNIPMAVSAVQAGASGFLEKPFTADQLTRSIEHAITINGSNDASNAEKQAAVEKLSKLTARERDIFEHIVLGETNKNIALILGISPRTVEVHRLRIRDKLGADSLADLIRLKLSSLKR